jgi:RimJ/RimL family protein N-acetyltransferase
MKNPFLVGDRLYLRGLVVNDLDDDYLTWLNDAEVCQYNSHHVFPFTRESGEDYIRRVSASRSDLVLAVVLKENDVHIGNISLQRISCVNRNAEFAILFGAKEAWGKGYAKEAARLLLNHGFRELNLHRIYCGTSDDNVPMQRLALALGMVEEGRRRQAMFKNARYVDIVEYGILAADFVKGNDA